MVKMAYAIIMGTNEKPNLVMNFFLSAAVIGLRMVRWTISFALGGGAWLSNHTPIKSGTIKMAPAAKGIHQSVKLKSSISHLPIVLARPDAKIKLVAKMAPISSVVFLPSKKPNTKPNTMPRGRPLINMQIIL